MSTRAQILISKKSELDILNFLERKNIQPTFDVFSAMRNVHHIYYRHGDGYPDGGLGVDIAKILKEISASEIKDVDKLAYLFSEKGAEYGIEKTDSLHLDIEYFYSIDMKRKRVFCFKT